MVTHGALKISLKKVYFRFICKACHKTILLGEEDNWESRFIPFSNKKRENFYVFFVFWLEKKNVFVFIIWASFSFLCVRGGKFVVCLCRLAKLFFDVQIVVQTMFFDFWHGPKRPVFFWFSKTKGEKQNKLQALLFKN